MPILFNGSSPSAVMRGDTAASAVYCGDTLVWSGSELPAGYKRCLYLESSGHQWIITDYYADVSLTANIAFSYTKSSWYCVAGVETGQNVFNFRVTLAPSNRLLYTYPEQFISVSANNIYNIIANDGYYYLDGHDDIANTIKQCNAYIYLFALNRNGSIADKSSGVRIYESMLYGTMLIPAIDANGTPCMYDTLLKKPLYNNGTGSFGYQLQSGEYVSPQ